MIDGPESHSGRPRAGQAHLYRHRPDRPTETDLWKEGDLASGRREGAGPEETERCHWGKQASLGNRKSSYRQEEEGILF